MHAYKKFLLLAACGVISASGFTQKASAFPVSVLSDPVAIANSIKEIAQQKLSTQTISNFIDKETSQLSDYIGKQTDLVNSDLTNLLQQGVINDDTNLQAQSQLMDAQDKRQVMMRVEDEKLHATEQTAQGPAGCNVITEVIADAQVGAAREQWRAELVNGALDAYSEIDTSGKDRSPEKIIQATLAGHCTNGAGDMDVSSGMCKSKTQNTISTDTGSSISPKTGHDLNAQVLTHPRSDTLDHTEMQQANSFIRTSILTAPPPPPPNNSSSSASNRAAYLRRMSIINQTSQALDVLAQFAADAAPLPGSDPTGDNYDSSPTSLHTWAENTAEKVAGYLPYNNFPHGVSYRAVAKLRSRAWYGNADYAFKVSSANEAQNVKDLTLMTAWQVKQQEEIKEVLQQISLSLALLLADKQEDRMQTQ